MRVAALWLLLTGLIAGLTFLNPNHYLSVDSQYYLSMAGWLVGLDGDQYGHVSTGWESTFPIGYPLLIGALARLTGTSLLVASKLWQSLLLGGFLLNWQRRLGSTTTRWMGSVLLLGGFVRLLTYTWSEWAFVVVLLECYWLTSQRTQPPEYAYSLRLWLLTMGLFLLRYVGGFVVVAYGLQAIVTYWRGERPGIRHRIGPDLLYVGLSVGGMLAYFGLNQYLTGSPYGGERFLGTTEPLWTTLSLTVLSLANELLLLRDYVPGESATLVWLGVAVQLGLLVWLWRIVRPRRETFLPPDDRLRRLWRVWGLASATYLAILFTLRLLSPFSGPNARMLAVVSLPLLLGVAAWVSRFPNLTLRRQLARWWAVLLLASWLQLLPQVNVERKLNRFFWNATP
ncbi:hypothetical protein FAES_2823 [Fibrella aestuarina BUZ 2]|uniref:Glycosyltransferase RgtA/B/C/D-like domain-containing protein n=1 Tax=Fibrella aestuarina BUZ 2 TaxID=1166018 RepID=I0K9M9_9BACT|nr:hypothetical protein [Fibrella aestuarina]CCH00832.1 hypothetical protein FAES_2823 [Fibrella aestuarina BUZ 2]